MPKNISPIDSSIESKQIGAAYIRVSTDDQMEYSPDAQLSALKDYAKKNNIILTPEFIYIDEGISGRVAEKRPAFMAMIGTAKQKPKPFDVILVHKFDRFARSREDSVVYKSLLKKECGIKVVSITENIEDDKFSIILEAMLEAMAEYYSLNLAEEVKKGMTEKAKRGEPQTNPSFGYLIENNEYKVNHDEAKFVKLIFDRFVDGAGYLEIAKELNALGVRTHRGHLFENRTVEYILRNPVYAGKLRWNPSERSRRNFNHPDIIVAEGKHEAIISLEQFTQAQEKVQKIKQIWRPYYKPASIVAHWLSGLISCSSCGGPIVKQKTSFQCNNYAKGKCAVSHSLVVKKMESAVLMQIEYDFEKPSKDKFVVIGNKSNDSDNKMLLLLLERAKNKLQRITEAFQAGIDTIEEYKTNKAAITKEIKELTNQYEKSQDRASTEISLDEFQKNLKNIYNILISENETIEYKNSIAREIIKSIIYDKKNEHIQLTYYV